MNKFVLYIKFEKSSVSHINRTKDFLSLTNLLIEKTIKPVSDSSVFPCFLANLHFPELSLRHFGI